eukprot:scaffold644_cov357-Pavlova_lutheri.AAC.25
MNRLHGPVHLEGVVPGPSNPMLAFRNGGAQGTGNSRVHEVDQIVERRKRWTVAMAWTRHTMEQDGRGQSHNDGNIAACFKGWEATKQSPADMPSPALRIDTLELDPGHPDMVSRSRDVDRPKVQIVHGKVGDTIQRNPIDKFRREGKQGIGKKRFDARFFSRLFNLTSSTEGYRSTGPRIEQATLGPVEGLPNNVKRDLSVNPLVSWESCAFLPDHPLPISRLSCTSAFIKGVLLLPLDLGCDT